MGFRFTIDGGIQPKFLLVENSAFSYRILSDIRKYICDGREFVCRPQYGRDK